MGCGFYESALANSVGTLIVDSVVKPVGRQLDFVSGFQYNVENLMEGKRELTMARDRLQHEIEDARRRLQQIEDDVLDLQSKADKILADMETLEEEIKQNKRCLNWCPNWSWRYRLSKKATKKTLDILKLLEKINKIGQLGRVGYDAATTFPSIEFLCSKEFVLSKSANTAFNQIIEALQDDNISMIGLWGMAGVGKTTLVHQVGKQAEKSKLFNKVVITTVSQKPNFESIQDEIAQYLGFDMKKERGRRSPQELWQKVKDEKRILIVLDDIWAHINLKEKIRIPLGEDHKGCKILLTTRRRQVCLTMDCQKVVPLGCLDGLEAWTLFTKKAGLNDSSEDAIKKQADLIIEKCQGLPISIVTLGSALKGKTLYEWKAAYQKLKERRLIEIEDVTEENAYRCLEASFDYLKDMETKKCFLLCSLFPEDYAIYVEDLVRYAWGLEFYKGTDSIEKVRTEVLAAMCILKNSCLLLDCGEKHVKMHDTVREVALWIASSRKEISFVIKSEVVETWPKDEIFEHYSAIYFKTDRIAELSEGLAFPNLKILLLDGDYFARTTASSEFFEGMKALNVCALNNMLVSLAAFQFQINLRTLHLESCELSDISILGKLKTVQVFSFHGGLITELPTEIGDLENLRLLDLSCCENLQRIPRSIQRLSNLEELYLHCCRSIKWATENATQEESYSSLSELNSLPKLVVLSLDISSKHLPNGFVFRKLQRFDICIGTRRKTSVPWKRNFEICPISRSLKVEASALNVCKQLFEDIKSLELQKLVGHQNLVPTLGLELDQGGFSKLISLELQSCEYMKCLIDTSKQKVLTTAFSNLVNLSLRDIPGLEELCNGRQPHVFLQKLKTLRIDNCREMICAIPILQNLQELIVESCDMMQMLFQVAGLRRIEQGPSHRDSLQSLKIVKIDSCNKLRYLFPMSVANSLGQLEKLDIRRCSELEEIIQATEVSNISLQSLREVHVEECDSLTSLSSLSHGQRLANLTALAIRNCIQLEYTFPTSMAEGLPQLKRICLENLPQLKVGDGNGIVLSLPSLHELKVKNCPQMASVITLAEVQVQQGLNHHVSLQSLKVVEISNCNSLKYLFPTSVANSLGKLEELIIESCSGLEEIIQAADVSNISLQSLREVHVVECNSLRSLKIVEIDSCNNMKYLFPTCVANSLGQLETLKILSCSGLEEIIQATDASNISLQSLREVHVVGSNNLTSLSSLSHCQSLENLRKLVIRDCCRLEYTFPFSMVEGLTQLNEVWLENLPQCKGRDGNDIVLTLPSLRELRVLGCPQLTPFIILAEIQVQQGLNRYPSLHSLKVMEIQGCDNLRYLFPMSVADSLGQLERLEIKSCLGLEEIIEARTVSEISLKSLKEVIVKGCNNLMSLSSLSHGHRLENLTTVRIRDCLKLECTFSISMAEGLPKLSEVCLENLPQLKGKDGNDIVLTLPSLQDLTVINCPQLTPFIISAKIQDLEFGTMEERKQMCNMIVPELKGRSANMEYLTITNFEDLFDSGYNLSSMRSLCLEELPELRVIWKGPIQVANFQILSTLVVRNCRRLRYIFSPIIARNLPQLSYLGIDGCEELEQIIEKDQTSSQDHLQPFCFPNLTTIFISRCENLKCLFPITVAYCGLPKLEQLHVEEVSHLEQVFEEGDEANVSTDKQKVIVLPQLESLRLEKLSNLVSFSPVRYHFIFPSLHGFTVEDCPNITTSFSVDSNKSMHAKTEASQSSDETIVEESGTA